MVNHGSPPDEVSAPSDDSIDLNAGVKSTLLDKIRELKTYIHALIQRFKHVRFFFSKAQDIYKDILGFDLDTSSVLCVQLQNPFGKIKISQIGLSTMPTGAFVNSAIANEKAVSSAIVDLITTYKIKAKLAAIAVPGSKVMVRYVNLKGSVSDEAAEEYAWAEAKTAFPGMSKSLYLDFSVIETVEADHKKTYKLMLVVVHKEEVTSRVDVLKHAKLLTKVIDVDHYAIARAYRLFAEQLPSGHENQHVAIINFDSSSLLIVVMQQDKMVYHSRQAFSGDSFVPIVQRILGLKDSLKSDVYNTQIEGQSQEEPDLLSSEQKEQLVIQLKRLLQLYYSERRGDTIQHIALTGRCALVPGVASHIEKMLGITTMIPNPFKGLVMNEKIDQKIFDMGPAFVLSCGLAMRGLTSWT